MSQVSQSRVTAAEQPDLRAAEGIMAAVVLSAMLWSLALLLLH